MIIDSKSKNLRSAGQISGREYRPDTRLSQTLPMLTTAQGLVARKLLEVGEKVVGDFHRLVVFP